MLQSSMSSAITTTMLRQHPDTQRFTTMHKYAAICSDSFVPVSLSRLLLSCLMWRAVIGVPPLTIQLLLVLDLGLLLRFPQHTYLNGAWG
jgi:hypothetical protein